MPSRALAALALLAATFSAVPGAHAEPARRVYVGIYLHDVTTFDQKSGTYEVDLDVWVKWLGDFDPGALRLQNEAGDVTREDRGVSSDGAWHSHRWRIRGTLRAEFPLQRFPFDVQTLSVAFELPERVALLTPDLASSGMASSFSITGWEYDAHFTPHVTRVVYPTDLGSLENEGSRTSVRRVRFDVQLSRPTVTIALKLFLPLVLLMLISMMALFLGPELVDPRAGIGVTVLLACFAFQFTVAGTIPDVSYLTIADSLFIVAYAMTTSALVVSIVVYWVHKNGNEAHAWRLDRVFRVLIPSVSLAATLYVMRDPPPPVRQPVPAYPRAQRAPTSRDVVRIGTLSLTSPTSGPLRLAVRAGLVETLPNGERRAVLAEQAPAVSNDMLRFLASGGVEVRWRLREGLRWSDGHALTSDDFRFALEVSPNEHIRSIETPDPHTLVLTYDDVLAEALDGLAPLPRHQLADEARADAGFEAVRNAQRTRRLASTGPYHITEFVAGDHAVAEPNPHYVGARPAIRRVEVRAFESADALAAAYREGRIDLVVPNALSNGDLRAIEAARPGSVLERASEDLVALSPDLAVPWLARLEVRRALLMALDRQAIERESGGRSGTVAHTPIIGLAPDPEDVLAYDPEAARAQLEAAGVVGQSLVLSHNPRKIDAEIAALIERHLEAAGLVVELRPLPAGGGGQGRSRAHGGLLLTTIRSDEESDLRRYWNLSRTAGRFVDADRNAVYDDAQATLTFRFAHAVYPERRHQLRARNARAVAHALPVLPLFFATERIVAAPELDGWDRGQRFGETLPDWHFVGSGAP